MLSVMPSAVKSLYLKCQLAVMYTCNPSTPPPLQTFGDWDNVKYYAYTSQAKEILHLIRVFLGMTKRGQIEQAPWIPSEKD